MVQFTIQHHWNRKHIYWQIVDPIISQSNKVFYTIINFLYLYIFGTEANKVILLFCWIVGLSENKDIIYFILFYL